MDMVIPGSEAFVSLPLRADELRARVSPKLRLHSVTQEQVDAVDPLSYEVIRHRLWAITEEMGETIKRMSGSHAVTEGNDFDFTIGDELGFAVQVGLYNTGLVGSMDLAVYWTLEHRSENPGIEPGDMFLCNDPWIGGGLHQNDAAVLAPIFHDGQLFCWVTAICHQLDLGGSAPGSWSPKAQDVFSESVPTPPIKVVRGGDMQRDVADAWVRRSRLPLLVGLDLRAKVGANTTAAVRIAALIEKYGADLVKAVMKRMMDDAERRLRAKLRGLPDGTWRADGYQEQSHEGDRGLHAIRLAMTKDDDRLIFDFTGTAPQAGMINCPYPGMRAGVVFALLPGLCGDIPWAAGGLLRCIEIISDEGTINNARFPAAVGKGPVGPAWASGNLVAECISKMLVRRPEARAGRVQSVCAGTFDLCVLAGVDERPGYPLPFVGIVFDSVAAGFGAQTDRDGIDTGGVMPIPQGRAPDIEMTEFSYPLLALWRREETDSGGPGRQRGGLSGSVCYVAHGSSVPMNLVTSGAGKAVNQNVGLAGGYPGCSQLDVVYRESRVAQLLADGRIPERPDQLGVPDVLPCEGEAVLMPGEAVYVHWQAGGGYGDPLLREPGAVVADVFELRVSLDAARDIYGVVLDPRTLELDEEATDTQRRALRAKRLAQARSAGNGRVDPGPGEPVDLREVLERPEGLRLDDNITVLRDATAYRIACRHCGEELTRSDDGHGGSLSELRLACVEGPSALAGPHVCAEPALYVDAEVVFRQLCCPRCGTAFHTAVVPTSHPLPADESRVE